MKVLCITPEGRGITPEMGFAQLLSKYGHDITLLTTGYDVRNIEIHDKILKQEFDVIWGMMEYSIPTAIAYGKLLNLPVHGHIECIPPWRINIEDNKQWGYDYEESLIETSNYKSWISIYNYLLSQFLKCDSRTISGDNWRYTFKALLGEEIDADTRYYTYNYFDCEKYLDKNILPEYRICTISRFVPLKRVHHIIKALSLIPIERRPKYSLVGYSNERETKFIVNLAKSLGVEVDFIGDGQEGIKYKEIQRSMFMVQISSGIPILEAAAMNRMTLSYMDPHMMEVYKDIPEWIERNNIEKLAGAIEKYLNDKELCISKGKEAHIKMINLCDNDKFIAQVEYQLKKAIKNHENKKVKQ